MINNLNELISLNDIFSIHRGTPSINSPRLTHRTNYLAVIIKNKNAAIFLMD